MTHATTDSDLCFLSAVDLARRLRTKDLSAREVLAAHLDQIERINPKVNAIVTLVAEQAGLAAQQADDRLARGEQVGPLHGLPVAHKDLQDTQGIRTTYGSPIFKNHIPAADTLVVERLKRAGAITVGKTNTPEFGAGSQTFNSVFGATHNPYDLSRTCGGSSGGAAVALACGMVPIADGSDMGGSLRNPASFCNVVGFRPSPGRVPSYPSPVAWLPLAVDGPMARSVADVAFLLSVLAGPDSRSPISIEESGSKFAGPLERSFRGVPVAWVHDLGFPVEPGVSAALDSQRHALESLGCIVTDATPDFSHADKVFKAWRAWSFELKLGSLLRMHPGQLKDTIVWNLTQGQQLTGPELGRIEVLRTELYHRVRRFMERYEFFVLPVAQVLPFDVRTPYPTEINSIRMDTYVDWMKSCYYISAVGNPALSVPCAFSPEGLPVGLQIVGRHHDDWGVLQLGHAFEQATGVGKRRPSVLG